MSAAVLLPSTISAGPPYFQLVPMCTIFIILGLHRRKCLTTGVAPWHLASGTSQFLASLGGCQLNMSSPNHGPHSTLVVTQVFKCGYRKVGDKQHALISRELAGWIGMAMCSWQVVDTALTQPCTRITGVFHIFKPLHSA